MLPKKCWRCYLVWTELQSSFFQYQKFGQILITNKEVCPIVLSDQEVSHFRLKYFFLLDEVLNTEYKTMVNCKNTYNFYHLLETLRPLQRKANQIVNTELCKQKIISNNQSFLLEPMQILRTKRTKYFDPPNSMESLVINSSIQPTPP